MSSDRQIMLGAVGLIVLVGAMARLFIWPGYREAAAFRHSVTTLKTKIAALGDENHEVQKLYEQVAEIRRQVSTELKTIPESPDVAELMRKLSLPVDGVSVLDQTFTAGSAEELLVKDAKAPVMTMPLKVEMTATFDSLFALMRAAESMDRLMRVSSLKVICKREEKSGSATAGPMLNASVGLEAIYDPPPESDDE